MHCIVELHVENSVRQLTVNSVENGVEQWTVNRLSPHDDDQQTEQNQN